MGSFADENGNMGGEEQKPLLLSSSSSKGGVKTLPLIIGNSWLINMATQSFSSNLITYIMGEYHMNMASGNNLFYIWTAISSAAPVIEAFIADSLLGRFHMIGISSVVAFIGAVLVWLPNVVHQAKPPPCSDGSGGDCASATIPQLVLLCASLVMLAIGSGGVISSSLAYGSDQLIRFSNDASKMERYITWFYAISMLPTFLGVNGLLYIQDNLGWLAGYSVNVAIMLLGVVVFFVGSAWYVRLEPKKNLVTGLFQVAVASFRNRRLDFTLEYHSRGSILCRPTEKLRCLNKACIVRDPEKELTRDGEAIDPWRLCTVDQVEELKALVKVIPIWFTKMMMSINICQGAFAVLQAKTMDRHIGPSFEIPSASVSYLVGLFVMLYVVVYDRVILPLASRIRGKTCHFRRKSRMACGIVSSTLAVATMAVVETIRRRNAIQHRAISILWVVPPYALLGIGEGLNGIAINEFYLSEFPKSMSSIASSLYPLGVAIASLVSSLIVNIINEVTGRGGNEGWLSNDINKGHYDYFNWVLAGISFANFLLFLVLSKAYGPFKDEIIENEDEII